MNRDAMSAALEAAGLERIVVGTSGGPALHPAAPGKFYETAYRRLAIAWNIFWQLSPIDLLWRSQIWGIGRVPNG